jgi:cytidine deaminase
MYPANDRFHQNHQSFNHYINAYTLSIDSPFYGMVFSYPLYPLRGDYMDDAFLLESAIKAREAAYAPYSGFKVGAALLTADGKVYTGCNIENAAYGPSNCAERTALFKAVSEGERNFSAIAIAGWADGKPGSAYPCGVCRQVMTEFCPKPEGFRILISDGQGCYTAVTLAELFPHGFGPDNLQ